MKNLIVKVAFAATFTAFAGYGVYASQERSKADLSDIMLANVEALSQYEQPDVADCTYDPCSTCEALHPTDPSKDQIRPKHKW